MEMVSRVERQSAVDIGPLLILFLAGVTALDAMAIDMYLPTFPDVMRDLGLTNGQIQQTLSVFLVGLALGQGFCGPFLERFGRRAPLLFGLGIFAFGSVLAALSTDFYLLLLARLFQAIGASVGLVTPRAIVTDRLNSTESAKVFSVLMQVMMIAPVLAPTVGSSLMLVGGWRSVFWALAVFSVGFLIWGLKITPETLVPEARKPLNLKASLRSYREQCADRAFLFLSLSGAVALGALFVYISTSPFIFIQHFKMTPQNFAYLFGGEALGMILLGQLNIFLLNRGVSVQRLAKIGIFVFAAGGVILTIVSQLPGATWWMYFLALSISIWSTAFMFGNQSALTMDQVKKNVGVASSLIGLIQYGFGAFAGLVVSLLPQSIANLPIALVIAGVAAFAFLKIGLSSSRKSESRT